MTTLFMAALLAWTLPEVDAPEPGGCAFTTDTRPDGTLLARAACRWAIPSAQVAGVVGRYERHDDVFSLVEESEALGHDAQGRALYRQVHAAPMLTDREVVLAVRQETLPDGVRYSWEKASPQPAPSEGRLEPRVNAGVWEIRDDGQGGARLDYEIRLHLDGSVPSMVVTWLQGVALTAFFEELEAAARRSG